MSASSYPRIPGRRRVGQAGQARLRLRIVLVQGPAHRQRPGAGQAVQPAASRLIAAGKVEPSFIVSHELPLDRAPEAYEHFDKRDDGWTKVVLHPDAAGTGV